MGKWRIFETLKLKLNGDDDWSPQLWRNCKVDIPMVVVMMMVKGCELSQICPNMMLQVIFNTRKKDLMGLNARTMINWILELKPEINICQQQLMN
jgi:hypothetical protein